MEAVVQQPLVQERPKQYLLLLIEKVGYNFLAIVMNIRLKQILVFILEHYIIYY